MKRALSCIATLAIAACAADPLPPARNPGGGALHADAGGRAGTPRPACTAASAQQFVAGKDIPGAVVDAVPVARARRAGAPGARRQPDAGARAGAAAPGARRPERAQRRHAGIRASTRKLSANRVDANPQSLGAPTLPVPHAAQPLSRLGQRVLHASISSAPRGASWTRCARRSTTSATSWRPRA